MGSNYGFVSTSFYRALEWVWHFVYLQLLFLFSMLFGLIIFGLFPAFYSVNVVMDRWIKGDKQFSIFNVFMTSFKNHFFIANGYGLAFSLGLYILTFNYRYLEVVTGFEHTILAVGWVITVVLFGVVSLYLFPARILTKARGKALVKNSVILALAAPISLILLLVSILALMAVLYLVPGMIPFLSVSLFSFLIIGQLQLVVKRLQYKQIQREDQDEALPISETTRTYLKESTTS